jgi:hypothetical protein
VIAPPWFRGAWKREWIRYDGEPFEDRIVRDVQTPSVFGSVRIPIDRPQVSSFADADDAQLRALLAQKGFAGIATFDGDIATWHHAIDFQPPEAPDTARILQRGPSTVLEEGLDGSFAELWWNLAPNDSRFLGVEVTRDDRVSELLAVVGDHFVYARDRARDLPPAESLAALATTRAQMIELLDCELSYGYVRGGRRPWQIAYSTLPWREGQAIDFVRLHANGTLLVNTFTEEDLRALVAR